MKKRLFGLAMALTIIQGCSGGSGAKTSSELLETYGYKELQKAGLDVFASNYAVNESYVSNLPKGKSQFINSFILCTKREWDIEESLTF